MKRILSAILAALVVFSGAPRLEFGHGRRPLTVLFSARSLAATTALYSDNFGRANALLNGSTLDNAGGGSETVTWVSSVNWAIVSNQLNESEVGGSLQVATISGGSDPANAQYSIIAATSPIPFTNGGPVCRWTSGTGVGNGYLYYRRGDNKVASLYEFTNGSFGTPTSNGTVVPDDAVMTCQSNGTTIAGLIGGTLDVSMTDSAHVTGGGGIISGANGGSTLSVWDNFLAESLGGATTVPPCGTRMTFLGVGGGC